MTRTIVIDRSFRGIGRICRAAGTSNPVLVAKYDRMLSAFKDDGRVDLLRAIRDGVLTFAEAYDAYRRGALHELATADAAKLLVPAYRTWVKSLNVPDDCSASHKASLATSGDYLERVRSRARIGDLVSVLGKLRLTLGSQHPRSFNLVRSHCSAFVRDTLTKAHPLYAQVVAVQVRPVKRKRKGRPLGPTQLRNYFPNPETDPVDAAAWSMATTGMGRSEYWGAWSVESDRVHIEGTKREGRVRDIPLARVPSVPALHHQTFEKKFRERTNRLHQPYDLRRTYANALEAAGISRTRRRLYMGHGEQSVTDLYEFHEVRQFLPDDAKKLQDFFGLPPVKTTVTLVKKTRGA